MPLRRGRGSAPGERRGGRKKGTPNKRSIPAIQAAIKEKHPDLDSLSLQRCSAACILAEIEKLRIQKRYDPQALIDWCVKLARVAKKIRQARTGTSGLCRGPRRTFASEYGAAPCPQTTRPRCFGRCNQRLVNSKYRSGCTTNNTGNSKKRPDGKRSAETSISFRLPGSSAWAQMRT
jgi:hypothetical protein